MNGFKELQNVVEQQFNKIVEKSRYLYKLNAEKRQTSEESLLGTKTRESSLLLTKIDIVKYIVESKLEDAQKKLDAKEKAEKKEKIMAILASKQNSALEKMSESKLKEMLNSL